MVDFINVSIDFGMVFFYEGTKRFGVSLLGASDMV